MEKKIIWTEGDFCNLDDNNCFLDTEKYKFQPLEVTVSETEFHNF